MAQTEILSSVSRSTTYPVTETISAPNNCGLLAVSLDNSWTDQMLFELPVLNVNLYTQQDILFKSFDINLQTFNSDNNTISIADSYAIPLYNLPTDFTISVIPLFDNNSLTAHNELIENGIEESSLWDTETSTFTLSLYFDDTSI